MNKKAIKKGILPYIILLFIMFAILYFFNMMNQRVNILTYDEFMKEANEGNVEEVLITPRSRASVYEISGTLKGYEDNESFFLRVPLDSDVMSNILDVQKEESFKLDTSTDPDSSTFLLFLVNVLPMVILIMEKTTLHQNHLFPSFFQRTIFFLSFHLFPFWKRSLFSFS